MTTPVELIVGPARSGKAGRVLAAYRQALADAAPGRALMLVPTGLRRRRTQSLLLAAAETGVLLQPNILTLPEVAERLLAAAGRTVRRIRGLARRQVIRDGLDALDEKAAAPLGEVRTAPGLVDALDALLRELKAARVEPDAFGRALAGPLRTPRNRLLALLYTDYQRRLQDRDVYDDQGRFWHAAALLAEGEAGPFDDLALLAVDGFQHFDPAQLDVIQALSQRAGRTLITLTWQPDRPDLFGVTGRTRRRLRDRFGDRLTETVSDEPSGLAGTAPYGPADLERLRTRLFLAPGEEDAEDGRPPAEGQLAIVRAAGRTREVEAVARRAVDLAGGGATEPASIAVITRSLATYAPLVRQVFPQYGLPFRVETGVPLADVPVVRAAMAMVRLQAEDHAFRAVARVLHSTYFRPEAFDATPADARAAVRLARDAGVWTGREAYARGFAYLRGQLARGAGAVDDFGDAVVSPERRAERAAEIDRAEALLGRVFDATALPASATRRAFADALHQMIQAAGLWETARAHERPEDRARDLQALAGLETVLDEVARLDAPDGAEVTLTAFLEEVRRGLDDETIRPPEPADAPVVVIEARRATDPTFDHVFLVGLAEKAFPRRGRRRPFFSDAERGDLRRRGVDLADTGHHAQEEMLRFYMAATRAGRSLTLSYPSLDSAGRPQLPSHYVEEVKGLFAEGDQGSTVPETEVGVRDLDLSVRTPPGPAEAARSRRELLAVTLFALWGPGANPKIDRDLAVLATLAADGHAVETALAGLAAEWEREHGQGFGRFDGCLEAPDILDELCRWYPGASAMSARRLERFGRCPFAFLAGEVLGLAPKEEPSPDLAPMDLGLIIHGVLERFFRAVGEHRALAGRITEETRETALALLEETAEAYFGRLESAGRVGSPALWSVQRRTILRDLRRLVTWHAQTLGRWRVAETEWAFGTGDAGAPPLTVPTDHGPLPLRGRIDRIDRGPDDANGVQIVDYKSGTTAPSQQDMRDGTSFQLPLYLMAAEALLGAASSGDRPAAESERDPYGDALARAFFLPVRNPGFRSAISTRATKKRPRGTADPARERAAATIRRFIEAIRRGRFPVYPRTACGRCDFAGICRYAEWRSQRKWEASPIPALAPLPDGEDETGADAPPTEPHGPDEKGGA